MREKRLCLRALEKGLVDSLELKLHVRKSGRGVGSRGQMEGLTFDRTLPALQQEEERRREQTQSDFFRSDARKLRKFSCHGFFFHEAGGKTLH